MKWLGNQSCANPVTEFATTTAKSASDDYRSRQNSLRRQASQPWLRPRSLGSQPLLPGPIVEVQQRQIMHGHTCAYYKPISAPVAFPPRAHGNLTCLLPCVTIDAETIS